MVHGIKSERGFTLLEIMVAMAIMAIALVTVIQLFSGALRSARVSQDYSLAIMGAKEKMEEITEVKTMEEFDELQKAGEFENPLMKGYHWEILGPDPHEIPEGLRTDMEEESGALDDLPLKLYQVRVRVHWASGLHEKEVSLATLKILEKKE